MRAIDFLERLKKKDFFREFEKEYPGNFLCAVFCILNKDEKEGDKVNLDFFVPSEGKIAYSESPFHEILFSEKQDKNLEEIEKLDRINIDLGDLWAEVERIKNERKIKHNTGKIIGVLTKDKWNLTCMSSSLEILRIKIDPFTREIFDVKKESLSDIIKIQKNTNSS